MDAVLVSALWIVTTRRSDGLRPDGFGPPNACASMACMQHRLRPLAALCLLFVGLQVVFLVGVLAAEAIPDRRVADELATAVADGRLNEVPASQRGAGNGLDDFTDCVVLTMGLGDATDSNPAETAITSPTLWRCELAVPALEQYRVSGGLDADREYFWYWHGYTPLTRPLLAVVGLDAIPVVFFALLLGATAALSGVLARGLGWGAPVLLLAPLVLTSDFFELPLKLPAALSMAVALMGGAAAWLAIHRWRSEWGLAGVGIVAGSLYVYVDLLTNPPLAWLATGGLAMLAAYQVGWGRSRTTMVGGIALASWLIGYGASWVVKWFLAALVIGFGEALDAVRDQIEFRLDGEHVEVDESIGAAIDANFETWFAEPLFGRTGLVLLGAALGAACVVAYRRSGTSALTWLGLLALPSFIPLIWLELLSNHSQIHQHFTYRALPFALGYLLLVVYAVMRTETEQPAQGVQSVQRRKAGRSMSPGSLEPDHRAQG